MVNEKILFLNITVMKRILLFMICAVFAFSTAFAQNTRQETRKTVTFAVNITCENCVQKVEKNINFERGVTDLKCELASKTVQITYRPDRTTEENLVAAFKKIGYEAEVKTETAKPAEEK